MAVGVVLGLLLLLTSYYSDVGADCNVTGVWVNTLGSVLKISAEGSQLKGSMYSSVELYSGVTSEQMTGNLVGLMGEDQPTFTMSISWKGGSVAAWVGQCFQTSGCPVLKTTWLLRSNVTVEDNWKATRIGEDVFYPQKKCVEDKIV